MFVCVCKLYHDKILILWETSYFKKTDDFIMYVFIINLLLY